MKIKPDKGYAAADQVYLLPATKETSSSDDMIKKTPDYELALVDLYHALKVCVNFKAGFFFLTLSQHFF